MSVEDQAKEQGWVPKEEWKGPPEKWTDAANFVEKGEKVAGILKSRVDRQSKEIEKLKSVNTEYGQFMQKSMDSQKQASEARISELEKELARSVSEGDGEKFTRLNREIQTERQDMSNVRNPQADVWLANNEWYNTDRELHDYADRIADGIVAEGYTGPAYWSELTRRVKENNPDKFANPNKQGANSVESGGEKAPVNKAEKSYDNLPDYAKQACDSFVSSGITTQEDYIKNFEWDKP